MKTNQKFTSAISGLEFDNKFKILGAAIRLPLLNLIKNDYPNFDSTQAIADTELLVYRKKYISNFLEAEKSEQVNLNQDVLEAISDKKAFVNKLQDNDSDEKRTLGQKIADKVAAFGGSWKFIIFFFLFILVWIAANVFILLNQGFDPYPFILLNLILSCLAALQAPVIMMSQNRQEEKDRERAKKDYMVNLKSELEIRILDDKLDHLIIKQQHELIEIQKVQLELMNDILKKIK